jgi:hypothetical protein
MLVALYLVLAWLLSSFLSRGQGFVVFVVLLLPLVPTLVAFRRGRRTPFYAVLYALLLGVVGAAGLEGALRLRPQLLGGQVANVAFTGYHWQRGGIYDLDPHAGPVMRPDVHRRMYWSGYWWQHDSNARGFRGPEIDRADAVVLGDSMIYGHGVEIADTVAARLEAETRLVIANLGQQGTCPIQAYLTLLRRGLPLRPRVVFLFVHLTDIEDVATLYDDAELRRFADAPAGSAVLPRVRPFYQPLAAWNPAGFWSRHVALPTESSAALGTIARALRGGRATAFVPRDPFVPTAEEIAAPVPGIDAGSSAGERLAWRALRAALARVQHLCQAHGARLVVFDMGYPRQLTEAVEAEARALGADYSPAGRVGLLRAQAGEPVYLANDGHWTGQGAAVVARELARALPVP